MPSMYEKLLTVIVKNPESRTDFECQELVPWFRNRSVLFETLKPEIVSDVIRHCAFERKKRDDVIIKQGESGDRLFIILKGLLSIYVIQDKDDSHDILQQVDKVCSSSEFDRSQLGQYVWTSGEGKTVGEIALLKEDCIRTASVVADGDTDLVVIDRALYSRSVQDVLEQEYQQKTKFVDEAPLFQTWPSKQRKQLVISLKKEVVKYGSLLNRQGAPADNVFFILSGEAEMTCDQSLFRVQYRKLWNDMELLLPGLLPKTQDVTYTPHESLKRKKVQHKLVQMCLLGSHEVVGALEILLGLKTYTENAVVSREADILVLSKENYDRLFNRKFAQQTVQTLRERLTSRLYLYIHRTESLSPGGAPFFKFLTFMLQDEGALKHLKKLKRKEKEEKRSKNYLGVPDAEGFGPRRNSTESLEIVSMLKVLNIRPKTPHGRLPVLETSTRVIKEIEDGLKSWVDRSKGGQEDDIPVRRPRKRSPYLSEAS